MDWKQIIPAVILAVFAVTLGIMLTGYFTLPEIPSCTVYCNSSSCVSTEAANPNSVICLDSDITGNVTILADNVTLNCQNYLIDGNDAAYGIYSVGFNELTIANCEIINASKLVYVRNSYGSNIFNNILHDSSFYVDNTGAMNEYGIDLSNLTDSSIINNTIYNIEGVKASAGINSNLLNNVVIDSNIIHDVINGEGVFIASTSSNVSFISNDIYNINGGSAYGAIIYADDSNISFNRIFNSSNGMGVYQSTNTLLDGNEFYNCIEPSWGVGLELWEVQDIYMLNGKITENNYGVFIGDASEIILNTSNVSNNAECGIYIDAITNSDIINNEITENGLGIYFYNSNNTNFVNNNISFSSMDVGVYIQEAYYNNFTDNIIENNFGGGIDVWDGAYPLTEQNIFSNNSISFNQLYGLRIDNSYENEIINNYIEHNLGDGIHLFYSGQNTIANNEINFNGDNGVYIYFKFSGKNNLTNNTINSNTNAGLFADSSYDTIVSNNIFSENKIGVVFYDAYGYLENNNISFNTDWDFYGGSKTNTITNLTIDNLILNFVSNDITLSSSISPEADISGYSNISKYLNITANELDSWVYINVSYDESDIPAGFSEYTLKLLKHNGTEWIIPGSWASPNSVNLDENYVYANITDFGSIFAPMVAEVCDCVNQSDCEAKLADTSNCPGGINITEDVEAPAGLTSEDIQNILVICKDGVAIVGDGTAPFYNGKANNSIIQNCIIKNYTYGVFFTESYYNRLLNNTFEDVTSPIRIIYSSYNDIIENTILSSGDDGIHLFHNSKNNLLERNTIFNCGANSITLHTGSDNNTVINNIVDNTVLNGIFIYQSSYNNLIGNTVNNNSNMAFLSYSDSVDNVITDLLTDDTYSSFIYGGDILLKPTSSPKNLPDSYTDTSHFLDITNNTAAWISINISYSPQEMIDNNILENTLKLWKYNDSWHEIIDSGVDTTNKYVYSGNITEFSIFAPLGEIRAPSVPSTGAGATPTRQEFTCAGKVANYYFNILNAFETKMLEGGFCNDLRLESIQTNKEVLGTEVRIRETTFWQESPETNYKYFEIYSTQISKENLEKLMLELRVSKEWVSENKIDVSTIELYKYADEWIALGAEQTYTDESYYYFTAETEEFSVFTVSGESVIEDDFWHVFEVIQGYYMNEISFEDVVAAINTFYRNA